MSTDSPWAVPMTAVPDGAGMPSAGGGGGAVLNTRIWKASLFSALQQQF